MRRRATLRRRARAAETVPLAARTDVPADADRADPLTILQAQDATRLPEVVPLRYGRMSRTPFTFLRGAAAVMAGDLAARPRPTCGSSFAATRTWGISDGTTRRIAGRSSISTTSTRRCPARSSGT